MTNSFFGGMPQQKGVAPQAAPSGTNSLNNDIDPVKRAKFTGYLQGISENTVPQQQPQPPMMPQGMGMPPMPPQGMMPPMQPPMMPPMMPPRPMNMGGMVDVFDPRYMNEGGFVISTDDSGKIRTRPVFDENKGRMVSQILSRDMVDEMEKAAMAKANQPEPAPSPIVVEPESTLVAINKILEDDYESGKGFAETMQPVTTTTVEPKTATISLPTPKPVIQLPVSKPKFSDIELPVSKPRITTTGDIDPFNYFLQSGPEGLYSKRTKPFIKPKLNVLKSLIGEEDGGIEEYDDPEELRDAAIYSDIRDIDDLGTVGATIPPEEMETIARMVTEGEKLSGPEVNIFDVIPFIDRFGEMNLNTDEVPKLRKLTGLAKLLRFLGLDTQFTAPSGQGGVDSFYDGGIVQGFRAGGVAKDRYEDFSSNISGNVGGRAEEVVDRYNRASSPKVKEMIINRAGSEVEPIVRGTLGDYDPGSAGDEMGSEHSIFADDFLRPTSVILR